MKPLLAELLCACAIGLAGSNASATTFAFTATLSGASERPVPNSSTATGSISVQLDDVTNMLSVQETYSGLSSAPTGAHIHCCAGPNATAAVAIDFHEIPGTGAGAFPTTTTGTYNMTFDLTNSLVYGAGFLLANGNNVMTARTTFINGLLAGQTYANIHNAPFPAGEIRGQLTAVPEPASWAMMIGGFALIGVWMRRGRSVTRVHGGLR